MQHNIHRQHSMYYTSMHDIIKLTHTVVVVLMYVSSFQHVVLPYVKP